jgi:hypothetical protein
MTVSSARTMLQIRLGRNRLWRWQWVLVERLARYPQFDVRVDFVESQPVAPSFRLLMMLERLLFRIHGEHACDAIEATAFSVAAEVAADGGAADVVLDLSGVVATAAVPGMLQVHYDGHLSEDAAVAAMLDGRAPELTVVDVVSGRRLGSALPAIEDSRVMTRALDPVFSALLQLCIKVVLSHVDQGDRIAVRPSEPQHIHHPAVLAFGLQTIVEKLRDRIDRLCHGAPRWLVGWRRLSDGFDAMSLPALDSYQRLPDDGGRYYADPFLLVAGGTNFLFVEEYDRAAAKGLISVTALTAEGSFQRPRPVLETDTHLSYPHVFLHDGQYWMIPESMQARAVQLYRAERFPDKWVHEATLLDGIEASDATVVQHNGLWWMFAATRQWLGSNWDTLSVFWAQRLQGPWLPHDGNPITIDSRSARPAGHFFHHGGALWRPAQDCSDGYGSGLALCRVEQLSPDRIVESVQHVIRLRDGTVSRGPHTLNRAGGIEVIDLYEDRS